MTSAQTCIPIKEARQRLKLGADDWLCVEWWVQGNGLEVFGFSSSKRRIAFVPALGKWARWDGKPTP